MKAYRQDEVIESVSVRCVPPKGWTGDHMEYVRFLLHGANAFGLVQCKDCRSWKIDSHCAEMNGNDFCSRAERKEG